MTRAAVFRRSPLLLLAAVLMAMGVFMAHDSRPAAAQQGELLSVMLMVGNVPGSGVGCHYIAGSFCGVAGTARTFTYSGTDHIIQQITVSSGTLTFISDHPIPDALKNSNLALYVGSTELRLTDATRGTGIGVTNAQLTWTNTGLTWASGDSVTVKLAPRVPPHASSVLWSATLTPRDGSLNGDGAVFGCETDAAGNSPRLCSGLLSPSDSFTHGGTTYRVTGVDSSRQLDQYSTHNVLGDEWSLGITTSRRLPSNAALRVGGVQFLVRDAEYAGGEVGYNTPRSIRWPNSGLSWTAGEGVSLDLVIPAANLPTVSLSASTTTPTEGDTVTITASLSSALDSDFTVPIVVTSISAERGDYGALSSITITAGATSATGTIQTNDDTDPRNYLEREQNEDFTVALRSGLPPSVLPGSTTSVKITIMDDESGGL